MQRDSTSVLATLNRRAHSNTVSEQLQAAEELAELVEFQGTMLVVGRGISDAEWG
jgi:hypothetical protein